MTCWAERYVGLPLTDCAELCERVLAEQFGRSVILPTERRGPFSDSALIQNNRDDVADPVDDPTDGDGVLMIARGRLSHIGIYVTVRSIPHVLHALPVGVCLHRIRDLPNQQMAVEGYYRWR